MSVLLELVVLSFVGIYIGFFVGALYRGVAIKDCFRVTGYILAAYPTFVWEVTKMRSMASAPWDRYVGGAEGFVTATIHYPDLAFDLMPYLADFNSVGEVREMIGEAFDLFLGLGEDTDEDDEDDGDESASFDG